MNAKPVVIALIHHPSSIIPYPHPFRLCWTALRGHPGDLFAAGPVSSDKNRLRMLGRGLPHLWRAEGQPKGQPARRGGHANVAKPPLLVDRRPAGLDRPAVRQESLLHAHHVDLEELQPLGRVQRHQGHRIPSELALLLVWSSSRVEMAS